MAKEKLKDLSIKQLEEKATGLKVFIGIFIPLIIGLFYYVLRDYFHGEDIDWSILTIAICTLAGPFTLYPELQEIREEIKERG